MPSTQLFRDDLNFCEIYAQWEKWAEITPGHSDNSQGNNSQDSYGLVRQFIRGSGHIYIELWTELIRSRDTKHRLLLLIWRTI